MSAGSSLAAKMRCQLAFSMNTACRFTTPMANCVARIWSTPTPAMCKRGICSLPYVRQSDGEVVYFPSNLIENLFVSNGMSAGNTLAEAQVQCLSEIFERAVKREILEAKSHCLMCRTDVLVKYPGILAGIQGLEEAGLSRCW
jgi:YcaO-like protein with predicted kinase domain